MKLKYLICLVAISSLFVSCGGTKENKDNNVDTQETINVDTQETIVEEISSKSETPEVLAPTFNILAEMCKYVKQDGYDERFFYDITVNKNGTYSFSEIHQTRYNSNGKQTEWYPSKNKTYEGKWVVDYITVGEDHQKVYDLRWANGDTHLYIPEDGRYIYDTSNSTRTGSWDAVSNLNFSKGIDIVEFTTPVGKNIIKSPEDRIIADRGSLIGPQIVGKTFLCNEDGVSLRFEEEEYIKDERSYKYMYIEKVIDGPYERYIISDDGKTITSNYNGKVYTLVEE